MYVGVCMRLGRATHLEFHFILINTIWKCRIFLVCKKAVCFIFRNAEQQRILWKLPDISQKSENGGNVTTGLNLR